MFRPLARHPHFGLSSLRAHKPRKLNDFTKGMHAGLSAYAEGGDVKHFAGGGDPDLDQVTVFGTQTPSTGMTTVQPGSSAWNAIYGYGDGGDDQYNSLAAQISQYNQGNESNISDDDREINERAAKEGISQAEAWEKILAEREAKANLSRAGELKTDQAANEAASLANKQAAYDAQIAEYNKKTDEYNKEQTPEKASGLRQLWNNIVQTAKETPGILTRGAIRAVGGTLGNAALPYIGGVLGSQYANPLSETAKEKVDTLFGLPKLDEIEVSSSRVPIMGPGGGLPGGVTTGDIGDEEPAYYAGNAPSTPSTTDLDEVVVSAKKPETPALPSANTPTGVSTSPTDVVNDNTLAQGNPATGVSVVPTDSGAGTPSGGGGGGGSAPDTSTGIKIPGNVFRSAYDPMYSAENEEYTGSTKDQVRQYLRNLNKSLTPGAITPYRFTTAPEKAATPQGIKTLSQADIDKAAQNRQQTDFYNKVISGVDPNSKMYIPEQRTLPVFPDNLEVRKAHGGNIHAGLGTLAGTYKAGGKLLHGPGDGMSDSIPAVINGKKPQRAALADGEFVIPADVVSHLGNGSTEAGSRKLYAMMDKIRHARTGRKKQAPAVNVDKYLPA